MVVVIVVVMSLAMTGCGEGSCARGCWVGEKSWGDEGCCGDEDGGDVCGCKVRGNAITGSCCGF